MKQAQIIAFCQNFGLVYVRHTAGGSPNNYWLVVEVEELPTPETVPVIKQALIDHILNSLLEVEIRED